MFELAFIVPSSLAGAALLAAQPSQSDQSQRSSRPAAPASAAQRSFSAKVGPWLVVAVIVVAALATSPNFRWSAFRESPYAGDFLQEWVGGHLVLSGDRQGFYEPAVAESLEHDADLVGFTWDEGQYLPLVYPPAWYVAVSPLALAPFHAAAWLWVGLMVACLVGAVFLMQAATRAELNDGLRIPAGAWQQFPRFAPWLAVLCVLFVPVLESLTSGQKGTLCLLLFAATYLLLKRQRPLAAGLVFGLLAFKPQLALVVGLAMLAKRQWRFTAGAALTAVLLGLISLAMGGDVCRQYMQFAGGTASYASNAGYDLAKSHCLYGFFMLLFGGPTPAARLATLAGGLAVVAALWQLLKGPLRPASENFAWQWSGLLLATVLLSPHLFTYDLSILLLPLWLVTSQLASRPAELRRWGAWLAAFYLLPGISPAIVAASGVQLTVPLFAALLWKITRRARIAAAPTSWETPPKACGNGFASEWGLPRVSR